MYIYDQDNPHEARFPYSRRNIMSLWNQNRDLAGPSAQVIDHYEGSVIFTHLELVSLALECLAKRSTTQFLPGDLSYALMGLLRQRPEVVREDNDFQAFARLSLANDSNLLLERLCLLPKLSDEPWHSLSDEWDCALWEIYPKSQVCGIGDGETVIIDGIRGAAIRWKSFAPVLTLGRETFIRKIARYMIRTMPGIFLAGLLFVILAATLRTLAINEEGELDSATNTALLIPGLIFLVPSTIILLFSPALLRTIYRGKVWNAQPWLFGVEGYMSLLDLELNIFGSYEGKLKWSAFGSPLSRHGPDEQEGFERFYAAKDRSKDPDVAERIQRAKSRDGSEQVFTLVDTGTMTVTLFSAARPPVAMLLCGEEGGMQRALLCSYDWRTSTLYRETVLRVETTVSDKMQYMPRVRLGLRRE